ncbi:MAG: hypothetical protein ACRBF0_15115 [Calditrichia bacterium]
MTHRTIRTQLSGVFIILLLMHISPLHAQDNTADVKGEKHQEISSELKEEMQVKLKKTEDHLQLTDEQSKAFRPIIEESGKNRIAVLAKYGIDPADPGEIRNLSFRKKLSLRSAMLKVDKVAEKKLKEVLSKEQLKMWKEIAEERRAEMRKQIDQKK